MSVVTYLGISFTSLISLIFGITIILIIKTLRNFIYNNDILIEKLIISGYIAIVSLFYRIMWNLLI
jgi:hypothetical protein